MESRLPRPSTYERTRLISGSLRYYPDFLIRLLGGRCPSVTCRTEGPLGPAWRGIAGGATMSIEALVGFGSPIVRPGFYLCTLLGVRSGATYIKLTRV